MKHKHEWEADEDGTKCACGVRITARLVSIEVVEDDTEPVGEELTRILYSSAYWMGG